ncbi:TlpA disulfide reductase family protein [Sphingobacterium paucimobilis]|nr:TlpA disulfide reductase family protein [Sphingobacterium paucimobilis]
MLIFFGCLAQLNVYGQSTSGMVLQGKVAGAQDGAPVRLVNVEDKENQKELVAGTLHKGNFELRAQLEGPTLVSLRIGKGSINTKGLPEGWASIPMMLEKGSVTINISHIDSVSAAYSDKGPVIFNNKHISLRGAGDCQKQYETYLLAVRDADYHVWQADRAATDYFMSGGVQLDSLSKLHLKEKVQEMKRDSIANVFMKTNPSYAISAWIGLQQARTEFVYSAEQLQNMVTLLKNNPDTRRYQDILEAVDRNKAYRVGTLFGKLQGETPTGENLDIASLIGQGKHTLIDFWASWCGPCRSAIPHVRSLYHQYEGNLNVIAVSLDEKNAAWKKAMEDEKMEWTQLWLPNKSFNELRARFNINSIPALMILNPSGQVVLLTNSSDEISAYLKRNI